MIQRVQQEDPYGCGVACVAMVSGLSYGEVRRLLGSSVARRLLGGGYGLTYYTLFDLLSHLGFACLNLWRTNQLNERPRDPWPPEPMADAHICSVSLPTGGHFVVWLRDGTVLDPARSGSFALNDYPHPPEQIIGIIPLPIHCTD